jgi:dihydrofolate reductase
VRKLAVFNFVTLNGFYKGADGDIGWHQHGGEESEYSAESLRAGKTLLFGRVTYEMMNSFWPTPMAAELFPDVAEGMNKAEKIVFSKTLDRAEWNNTRLVKGNLVEEIEKLKRSPGKDMTLLGSGSIVAQLAEQGLIDDYEFMVDPVILGEGVPIFRGVKAPLNLKLMKARTFKNGAVLLCYQPVN